MAVLNPITIIVGGLPVSASNPLPVTGGTGTGLATLGANTFTGTQTINLAADNVQGLIINNYDLTGANAQQGIALTGVWNTSGSPDAIYVNITNTASGANADLMSLGTGGLEQFRVRMDGSIVTLGAGGNIPHILGASGAPITAPADTNENILATVNIPAGVMGTNGQLFIRTRWSYTNSANNKVLRNRFGGIGGNIYGTATVTTTASVSDYRVLGNAGAANAQTGFAGGIGSIAATSSAMQTSAVDTSLATTLVFTAQKATAGETVILEGYIVELIPGV